MDRSKQDPSKLWNAVGAPSRFTRKTLHKAQRLMWWICWAVVWGLILWDVYLALDSTRGNTWSEVLRVASGSHPVLPWLLGALVAHLFHYGDELEPIVERDAAETLMGVLTLIVVVVGRAGLTLEGWHITGTALLGMTAALLLWPKARLGQWHW